MVSQKQYERVESYIRKGIDEGAGGAGQEEKAIRRVLKRASS